MISHFAYKGLVYSLLGIFRRFLNCNDDFLGLVLVPGDHSDLLCWGFYSIISVYLLSLSFTCIVFGIVNKVIVLLLLYASPSYSMYF